MHSRVPPSFIMKLCRTPSIMLTVMKGLFKKHISVNLDYKFSKEGHSNNFSQISLKITNKCNLRCKMCGQWGETGYNLKKSREEINRVVSLETYKKMVDDVSHIKPIIYIWGGEPFLYNDIMPLVAYMKEKELIVSLVTNGMRLEPHAEEIVKTGWDVLMLSLDGPREIHDEIRGVKGCFDKLLKGVKSVQNFRSKNKKTLPYIMVFVTITKENASLLPEIMKIGEDIGVDSMIIYYSWFTNEDIGEKHVAIMEEKLDCTPEAWKGYLFNHDVDVNVLQESVRKIQNTKYSFPYMFLPNLSIEDIPVYYKDPSKMFGYNNCVAPWLTAEVMPNGDVSLCRDYPDYIVGNIEKDSITDIFNGEKCKKFRKALRECGGLFPICARCCGLMGF